MRVANSSHPVSSSPLTILPAHRGDRLRRGWKATARALSGCEWTRLLVDEHEFVLRVASEPRPMAVGGGRTDDRPAHEW